MRRHHAVLRKPPTTSILAREKRRVNLFFSRVQHRAYPSPVRHPVYRHCLQGWRLKRIFLPAPTRIPSPRSPLCVSPWKEPGPMPTAKVYVLHLNRVFLKQGINGRKKPLRVRKPTSHVSVSAIKRPSSERAMLPETPEVSNPSIFTAKGGFHAASMPSCQKRLPEIHANTIPSSSIPSRKASLCRST